MADKTLSSQSHVEELTRMRTELAQERASIAIFKQEVLKKKKKIAKAWVQGYYY